MSSRKLATLSDVAREAGVSRFTVSAVVNGARSNTRVSEATRERILSSAARLRYKANAQARSLARQRTNIIGVLFDIIATTEAISNSYASQILQGILVEGRRRGYDVLLYTEQWESAEQSSPHFCDRRSDGVIVIAPMMNTDVMEGLCATEIPLCAISAQPIADGQTSMVDVDNAAGIHLAVKHLVGLGHRRILHLTGGRHVYSAEQRAEAFRDAICRAGLAVTPESIQHCTYDGKTVAGVLPDLLRGPDAPTAIVAGNDNIAIAVMDTARSLGIEVPRQLSVIGFDDKTTAAHVVPPLTTIRQPLGEIGAAAVTALIAAIEGEGAVSSASKPLLLLPELIVRESTAVVPTE